jgi:hypothetical protein
VGSEGSRSDDQETDGVIDTLGLASPRVCPSRLDVQLMNNRQDAALPASIIYIWSS